MLRTKITLLYVALVGLLVGAVALWVRYDVGQLGRADAEIALRRSATLAEQSARLDESALLEKAVFVASSERLYRSLHGEFVKKPEEGEEGAEDFDYEGQRHLDVHEKLTAQKYKLDALEKENASARNVERTLLQRNPHNFDIFMVVDAKGKGVAALGKDLYSWFGSDIGKDFPAVGDVLAGKSQGRVAFWRWAFNPGNEKRLYRVALAPVRAAQGEKPAGVVVIGTMINDGLAKQKQRLFAGLAEKKQSDDEAPVDEHAEAAPEVAFFRGPNVVGSTFDAAHQKALAGVLEQKGVFKEDKPHTMFEVDVMGVPYLALVRRFKTAGDDTPTGVAVLSSLQAAHAPVGKITVNVVIVGVLFLILGAFLIFFMVVRYIRPVEDLEDGIQEIIAGNKDHNFVPKAGHELQAGLAQQLNLMSAFLQGKPMPDEDEAGGGWGDLMGGGGGGEQGPGKMQGVDLAKLSAPPPKKEE